MHPSTLRGDFALNTRLTWITILAAIIGVLATLGAWVIAVPAIGGLIVGMMARFGSEKIRGHGIPEAIEAILFGKSHISAKVAVLKPLSSGIVIGSGGPFGAEGPIIMTGGAIGSLFAQFFHLTAAERKALLVAGATAGMTAVFGTPVAAVLLAVELLLFELRPRSLLPVAMACAIAGFARPLMLPSGPLFPLQTAAPGLWALPMCVLAGLACGTLSASLSASLYKVEDLFTRLPLHWSWWPAIGGLAVGIGGYFEPRALGVGYDVIGDLLHNQIVLEAVVALVIVKAMIWVLALGSGTSGGILAPLLIMGAGLGVVLGQVLPGADPRLWALVCMAATLAGVMRAPLTATIFAFGLTRDANALLPLIATSAVSYGFTVLTMRRSILTEKIARRGYHIYREYGVDPLERQLIDEVMTRDVVAIDGATSVDETIARYFGSGQAHRAFPVVRDGAVVGMADRELLAAAAARDSGAPIASALVESQVVVALPDESCRLVASRLALNRLERLPVVADLASMRLVGIVARSDLVKPRLLHIEEEEKRERARHVPWLR